MSPTGDRWPRNRRTAAFERRVASSIAPLLEAGERIVVACSGGPDSVATLVAACRVLTAKRVTAAHFDHGLRPTVETEADAAFIRTLAQDLGASAILGRPESRLRGDEASARDARYRWLASVLPDAGATALVTGHTRDDQAETVLLNLTRGAGLRGASGMRSASDWPAGAGGRALCVLRPLLDFARADIEEYLAALGLEARLDPTNELTTYARNRIRLDVLSRLEVVNPEVRAHLAGFATRAAEADTAIESWAAEELERYGANIAGHSCVERHRLGELPAAVAKRVLALAGARVDLELDASQQDALLRLTSRRGARLDLAGGVVTTEDRWVKFVASGR